MHDRRRQRRDGAYNVGRGEEVSVLDLVEQLRVLGGELGLLNGGRTFEPQFAPARLGEVQRSALDPTRSREELGFMAEVELEDGLRRTLQFVAQAAGRARSSRSAAAVASASAARASPRAGPVAPGA